MNEPVLISIRMVWDNGCPQKYIIVAYQGSKMASTSIVHPTEPNQLEANIKKLIEQLNT